MVTSLCGVDDHVEITVMSSAGDVKTVFSSNHFKIDINKGGFLGVC